VPNSTYAAIASSFFVEAVFDATIAIPVLIFAFTQGVFPKPPDFSDLDAFDLSFFASHPQLTLFLITVVAVVILVGFALLSRRVKAFWARVKQGVTILFDRHRYIRQVWLVQFGAWLFRCAAFWMLRNVLLVLGVNAIASLLPFTPGGAGVQQALLLKVFGGTATAATVAAYSVGQQIAIASFSLALGFAALVFVFRFRSFKAVIAAGREHRAAEEAREAERGPQETPATAGRSAPRARA
jgi:hypothetical protein